MRSIEQLVQDNQRAVETGTAVVGVGTKRTRIFLKATGEHIATFSGAWSGPIGAITPDQLRYEIVESEPR